VSGFQGRVGKVADTCYGWWIGASLKLLDAWHFVDYQQLQYFVFSCQSHVIGGFSKVPQVHPDPLHTYFSLCSLGMSGVPGFQEIDVAVGMTARSRAVRSVFDS
jgi:geranylgeranyl transferase type-1 subunit beta